MAYDRLHRLTYEPALALRADPALSESEAHRFEGYVVTLDSWAEGGEARGLSEDEADHLGRVLAESQQALVPRSDGAGHAGPRAQTGRAR